MVQLLNALLAHTQVCMTSVTAINCDQETSHATTPPQSCYSHSSNISICKHHYIGTSRIQPLHYPPFKLLVPSQAHSKHITSVHAVAHSIASRVCLCSGPLHTVIKVDNN
eukprot:jgi/Chrzof1/15033/Cz09g24200.t1